MSDNKERTFAGKMLDAATAGLGGVVGGIFGLATQKGQDRRQIRQQEKLNRMQIQGQKELADYQRSMQMQMWKDTNYAAQVEELKKAGLNPGLLYGMGGAGGATVGGGIPSTGGGQAAGHSGEIGMGIQAGLQAAMMQAQIKLTEAQANKVEAEIPKTEAETTSLLQGVENAKAQEILTKVQTELAELEKEYAGESLKARIKLTQYTADKTLQELNILKNEALISENTWSQKIDIVGQELIKLQVGNALTATQTQKTEAEIKQIAAQINKWSNEIAQNWTTLSLDERLTKVQEKLMEWNTSLTKEGLQAVTNIIGDLINFKSKGIKPK